MKALEAFHAKPGGLFGRDSRCKLSLRSRGGVDVAALAQRISPAGGGHAKAAGASISLPLSEALLAVDVAVVEALGG